MTRFKVTKEIEFDAGHRVPLHESQCRNPHGHRYRVVAHVEGPLQQKGSSSGMVVDFADIKRVLTEHVHDVFDHGFIMWKHDAELYDFAQLCNDMNWKLVETEWMPTAEEMARGIFNEIAAPIARTGGWLTQVDVWETPSSCAMFVRPDA